MMTTFQFMLLACRTAAFQVALSCLFVFADWLLIGPDGWGRLDVRAQIQMADGAVLYTQYHGLIEMNEAVAGALQSDTSTTFEQQYFRITPRFEASDPRYAWLEQSVFVGQGRIIPGPGVEYNVFRVT